MKNSTPCIPSTSRRSKTEADIPSEKAHFTPGPWEVFTDIFVTKDDQYIAQCFPCETEKQIVANAKIISAAPDMLKALEEALALIQDLCFGGCATVSDEECEKASAMLKKGYAALDKARIKNSTPSTPSIPSIPSIPTSK